MSAITTKAIRIDEVGPPEVMKYIDVTLGDPGPGEVLVRQKACGLNYIDLATTHNHYLAGLVWKLRGSSSRWARAYNM
jgi:NADPH2:quinone reductase